jgi:hypothetical protein
MFTEDDIDTTVYSRDNAQLSLFDAKITDMRTGQSQLVRSEDLLIVSEPRVPTFLALVLQAEAEGVPDNQMVSWLKTKLAEISL